ncbi:Ulp1 protease family protein [Abeliophyllum distichum]|uniref:Ulp1 protease family protein n=1 Tax=Abeliophyllum distichum TaxID=126358 RepID=A0ABD1RT88_9LAMI
MPFLKETEVSIQPYFTTMAPLTEEVASDVPDDIVHDYIKQGDAPAKDVSLSEVVPSCSSSMPLTTGQEPFERSNCNDQQFQQEVRDRLTAIEQLRLKMSNCVDQQFQQEVRDHLTAIELLPFKMSNCVDQQFQQEVRDRLTAIEQLPFKMSNCVDQQFQQEVRDRLTGIEQHLAILDAKFTSLGQHFMDSIEGFQQSLNHVELYCNEGFQHFDTMLNTIIAMLLTLINMQQPHPKFEQAGQSEQVGGFEQAGEFQQAEEFEQAGDIGAEPSYTPNSLIYSFDSQFNTEVGPEVTSVYKGRGHHAKKKSKILRSSYTNPDRRKRPALDTFNIFREINPAKELSFQSWYQSAKDNDAVDLTILVANKLWFSKLLKDGEWVEGEHVDVAMLFIRLRTESHPCMFLPRYAILDSTFGQCIYDLWYEGSHRFEPTKIKYPENVHWYLNGEWPSHGMSWSLCEHMLVPFNIGQSHWVSLDIDLLAWKLTVYDGDIACYVDEVMQEKVTCFLTLIPLILKKMGVFEQREWRHEGPLQFVRKKTEIPQTKKSGDCGVYAIKYIECLAAGRSVDVVTDENMLFWRRKLAVEMYSKEFDP